MAATFLMAMSGVSLSAFAQDASAKAAVTLINPQAIAFDKASGKVYIVDTARNAVNILDDAASTTLSVKVGVGPVSLAVNSASGKIYVANSGDGTVSVIDGKTDEAVATIQAGPHPYSVAANGTTGKVYVSHTFSNKVTIIDGSTDTASNIEAGSFDLIAVNSKTNTIYMLGYEGGNLVSMDGTGLNVVRKTLGMHAWGMELNEATGKLYVARSGSAEVDIVTPGVLSQASVKTGAIPCAVAINPTTNMIYVANYGGNSVTVISGTTSTPLTTISVGVRPEAITVDPISSMVYVANTHSDTVTVIDGKQNKVLNTLAAGKFPYALVVNPRSNKLHIMNLSDKAFTTVSLIPSRAD